MNDIEHSRHLTYPRSEPPHMQALRSELDLQTAAHSEHEADESSGPDAN